MNRKRMLLIVALLMVFGAVYYLYGGHSTPKVQPPLAKAFFFRAILPHTENCVQRFRILCPHVVVMLSPTPEPFVCGGPLRPDNCCGKSITRTYEFFRDLGAGAAPRILLRRSTAASRAFLMHEEHSIGIGVEPCLTCSENGTAQRSYGTTSRYISQEHCGKMLRRSRFILTVLSAT